MNEIEIMLSQLDEAEISNLVENIDIPADPSLSERIREKSGIKKKAKIIPAAFTKYALSAACFAIAVMCAFFLTTDSPAIKQERTTEPQTTESSSAFEFSLVKAIVSGDDGLIDALINDATTLSAEIMSIAVEYSEYLSYESLQDIGEAVYRKLGTTGLDSLTESTLLGDSQRALEELEKRENLLMTPMEKLAFFFSVAFCDSEVVQYFVEKGYDLDITDGKGEDVFEIARENKNDSTLSWLENYSQTA